MLTKWFSFSGSERHFAVRCSEHGDKSKTKASIRKIYKRSKLYIYIHLFYPLVCNWIMLLVFGTIFGSRLCCSKYYLSAFINKFLILVNLNSDLLQAPFTLECHTEQDTAHMCPAEQWCSTWGWTSHISWDWWEMQILRPQVSPAESSLWD